MNCLNQGCSTPICGPDPAHGATSFCLQGSKMVWKCAGRRAVPLLPHYQISKPHTAGLALTPHGGIGPQPWPYTAVSGPGQAVAMCQDWGPDVWLLHARIGP